jgi:hypothetical protein
VGTYFKIAKPHHDRIDPVMVGLAGLTAFA